MSHLELLEEACAALSHTTRAMFGGHGLFAPNGGMFAATVDDGIILKFADEPARAQFEALGGRAWTYADKMTMREWILIPDALYDEPRELARWAALAHKLAPPKKARAPKAGAKKARAKQGGAKKAGAKKGKKR